MLGEVLPFLAGTKLAGWFLRIQPNGFIPLPQITRRSGELDNEQRQLLTSIISKPREEWIDGIWDLYNNKNEQWVATALKSYTKRKSGGGILEEDRKKLVSVLTSTVNFRDSDFILNHVLPDNHLGCPPTSNKSEWPDFVIVQHQQMVEQGRQQRVLRYVLWWQIKLLGGETWHEMKEEISKVPELGEHRCLVIVSTRLSTDVLACISGSTHLLFPPGVFKYKGKPVITIPDKLEVVVLGARGLAQLYSEYDLDGLKRLAAANSFESISRRITQPTVPLAGVSLMPAPVPGRSIKVNFVDGTSNSPLCSDVLNLPFGTTLDMAKAAIIAYFHKNQDPSLRTCQVTSILWNGIPIVRDDQLESIQHRDDVVIWLQ